MAICRCAGAGLHPDPGAQSRSTGPGPRIGGGSFGRTLLVASMALWPGLALAATSAGDQMELAYIDPGTGSFLIQVLIAAVAGAAFTIRHYWQRIKSFFRGAPDLKEEEGASSNKADHDG